MALRLKVAGIAEATITETQNLDEVIDSIKDLPTEHVYILATYTIAVLQLRKTSRQRIHGRRNDTWLNDN